MKRKIAEPKGQMNQRIKGLAGLYRGVIGRAAISDNEFWVWYTLVAMDGEYSQQDISTLWSLPKQTVNAVVRRMVRRGLATLEVVPGTRNRKNIHLTEAGREYGEKMIMPVSEAEQRAFQKMTPEDQTNFMDVMGKYINALREELLSAVGGPAGV